MKMHYDMMKMSQKKKTQRWVETGNTIKISKRNISTFDIDPPFDINN